MTTTATLTKMQVRKALASANITATLSGRGTAWEVEVANDKTKRAFQRQVANVGGYKTGCGSWVLRPNYQGNGDWNDKASRWHY